jgi:hypothetical protein
MNKQSKASVLAAIQWGQIDNELEGCLAPLANAREFAQRHEITESLYALERLRRELSQAENLLREKYRNATPHDPTYGKSQPVHKT